MVAWVGIIRRRSCTGKCSNSWKMPNLTGIGEMSYAQLSAFHCSLVLLHWGDGEFSHRTQHATCTAQERSATFSPPRSQGGLKVRLCLWRGKSSPLSGEDTLEDCLCHREPRSPTCCRRR